MRSLPIQIIVILLAVTSSTAGTETTWIVADGRPRAAIVIADFYGGPHTSFNREVGIWKQDEGGSLQAVYEFLRMQGVRWYWPGELGEVIPQRASIALPPLNRSVNP